MNAKRYDFPADRELVESVPDPHFIRPANENWPKARRPPPPGRAWPQLQPLEQPLQGPSDGAHPAVCRRIRRTRAVVRPGLSPGFSASASASTSSGVRGAKLAAGWAPAHRTPGLITAAARPGQRRVRHRSPAARPALVGTAEAEALARQPRSAWLSPGSRSSCTSEYGNRPVSRFARLPASSDPPRPQSSRLVPSPMCLPLQIQSRVTGSSRSSRSEGNPSVEPSPQGRHEHIPASRPESDIRGQQRPSRHHGRELPARHREQPATRPPPPRRQPRLPPPPRRPARRPSRVQRHRVHRDRPGQLVKNSRTPAADVRNRRSRSRTVSSGTPEAAAIDRNP